MGRKRIAVIGGGITGLSAAYYLQKSMKEERIQADLILYEAAPRLGGNIRTDYTNGFVSELGPDSYLARKTAMTALIKEVGLGEDLVYNSAGKSYILSGDSLYPMPGGAIMGIPTQWGPFLSTKLFSLAGKTRAAGDLILPRVMEGKDVSLGTFFRKRLGDEVVDRLIDPLLSGIYAGDIDRISLRATFPHFEQLEQKYRSLILGMKSSIAKQQAASPTKKSSGKGKPSGMFLSLKGGLQSLVDAVENQLGEEVILKNAKLTSVKKQGEMYVLNFEDGRTDTVDYVIMTAPHKVVAELFNQYTSVSYLKEIPSTSVATVVLAFPQSAVKKDIDGTGFVVSKKTADYSITACTWTHKKWQHSTPEGYVSLRGYVGRFGDDEIVSKSNEEILSTVMSDLNRIMDIEGEPLHYKITRWKEAMPQYEVGHVDKIQELKRNAEKELPGVLFTGSAFEGIGLPDCIVQGKKAAEQIAFLLGDFSEKAGD